MADELSLGLSKHQTRFAVGSLFRRSRMGAALGVTLLTAALACYSSGHRVVYHWSTTYFGVLLVVSCLAAASWSRSWRLIHGADEPSASERWSDWALLGWGTASMIAAVESPAHAGDLLNGNTIGSEVPLATLVSWLALVCLTLAVLSHSHVAGVLRRHGSIISLAALLVLSVLGEGVVRVLAVSDPQVQAFPTHRTEMWLNRYVHLNAEGFRDGAHNGLELRRRLLVVGDSYAFGWGIRKARDRVGELLARALDSATGTRWEPYNISRPDMETRQETELLRSTPSVHPDVAIVVYVFNDIEYLEPITERVAMTEAPSGLFDRVNPWRILFMNSFLFQELYVRGRHARLLLASKVPPADPYADSAKVARHLKDVCRLVRLAGSGGAVTALVPLDVAPVWSSRYAERMERFVREAQAAGIPVLRVDTAFTGRKFEDLTVNALDPHPNELADRLVARVLAEQLLPVVRGEREPTPVTCQE